MYGHQILQPGKGESSGGGPLPPVAFIYACDHEQPPAEAPAPPQSPDGLTDKDGNQYVPG